MGLNSFPAFHLGLAACSPSRRAVNRVNGQILKDLNETVKPLLVKFLSFEYNRQRKSGMVSLDNGIGLFVLVGMGIGAFSAVDRPVVATDSPEAVYAQAQLDSGFDVARDWVWPVVSAFDPQEALRPAAMLPMIAKELKHAFF